MKPVVQDVPNHVCVTLLMALLVSGCATRDPTTPLFTEFEPAPVPVESWGFVPGDQFVVGLEHAMTMTNVNVIVDENGYIELPEIGKFRVLGLSPEQAGQALRNERIKRGILPAVYVPGRNPRPSYQVRGEVGSPNRYGWFPEMRLSSAIESAGGLTKNANRKVTILRQNGAIERHHYQRIVESTANDPPIWPDDIIMVKGKSPWWRMGD